MNEHVLRQPYDMGCRPEGWLFEGDIAARIGDTAVLEASAVVRKWCEPDAEEIHGHTWALRVSVQTFQIFVGPVVIDLEELEVDMRGRKVGGDDTGQPSALAWDGEINATLSLNMNKPSSDKNGLPSALALPQLEVRATVDASIKNGSLASLDLLVTFSFRTEGENPVFSLEGEVHYRWPCSGTGLTGHATLDVNELGGPKGLTVPGLYADIVLYCDDDPAGRRVSLSANTGGRDITLLGKSMGSLSIVADGFVVSDGDEDDNEKAKNTSLSALPDHHDTASSSSSSSSSSDIDVGLGSSDEDDRDAEKAEKRANNATNWRGLIIVDDEKFNVKVAFDTYEGSFSVAAKVHLELGPIALDLYGEYNNDAACTPKRARGMHLEGSLYMKRFPEIFFNASVTKYCLPNATKTWSIRAKAAAWEIADAMRIEKVFFVAEKANNASSTSTDFTVGGGAFKARVLHRPHTDC